MTQVSQNTPDGSADPSEPDASPGGRGGRRHPFSDPWFRFAAVFGVLAISGEIAYYAILVDSPSLKQYLELLARISEQILLAMQVEVERTGTLLSGSGFSVQIAHGCDAIQICALITCAMVAFPSPALAKVWGIVGGIFFLQMLNQARIVSLLLIGQRRPEWFESAHLTVWPAFLIVVTVLTWITWVRLAVPAPLEPEHEA